MMNADLYFVDGGHSEETIENDAGYVLAELKRGQVAVFDDYYHAGKPEGMGCNKVIDSIDRAKYLVEHLPARTVAADGSEIGMVKVSRNKQARGGPITYDHPITYDPATWTTI